MVTLIEVRVAISACFHQAVARRNIWRDGGRSRVRRRFLTVVDSVLLIAKHAIVLGQRPWVPTYEKTDLV